MNRLSTTQTLIFILFFSIVTYLMGKGVFSLWAWIIMCVGGLLLFYFILTKPEIEDEIITLREAKAILAGEIKYMQKVGELPNGSIDLGRWCKLRKIEGIPLVWMFGFKIGKQAYHGLVNPFGKIEGITETKKIGVNISCLLSTPLKHWKK